jgi:hypothetical protein
VPELSSCHGDTIRICPQDKLLHTCRTTATSEISFMLQRPPQPQNQFTACHRKLHKDKRRLIYRAPKRQSVTIKRFLDGTFSVFNETNERRWGIQRAAKCLHITSAIWQSTVPTFQDQGIILPEHTELLICTKNPGSAQSTELQCSSASGKKSHRKRTSQSVPAVRPEAILDSWQSIAMEQCANLQAFWSIQVPDNNSQTCFW